MDGNELFGVIVRTTGLGMIAFGLWYLMFALASIVIALPPDKMPKLWWFAAFFWIVVGVALILGANTVVKVAYP